MGVEIKIVLYDRSESHANQALDAAFARIAELERIFSDYKSDSELRVLCRTYRVEEAEPVSDDLFHLLDQSRTIGDATDGVFDVTVGNLVQLWRRSKRLKRLPEDDKLRAALDATGHRLYRLDRDAQTVTFTKPGMRLDFGGIAKGYAGDAALAVLQSHGITRAILDCGGDIIIGDPPPGEIGWEVPIGLWIDPETKQLVTLVLKRCAVATSGDFYRKLVIDGESYSHIVDPQTGLGVRHSTTVTVIAADGATADAYASAYSVMTPAIAIQHARERALHDVIIQRPTAGGPTQAAEVLPTTKPIHYPVNTIHDNASSGDDR